MQVKRERTSPQSRRGLRKARRVDTNFFFLMEADPGNPLYFFETAWGSHLLGFPVIIVGVLLVMQGPFALLELKKKNK